MQHNEPQSTAAQGTASTEAERKENVEGVEAVDPSPPMSLVEPLIAALDGLKAEYFKALKEGPSAVLELLGQSKDQILPAPSPELYALNKYISFGRKSLKAENCHGELLKKGRAGLDIAFYPTSGPLRSPAVPVPSMKSKYGVPGYWVAWPGVDTRKGAPTVVYIHGGAMTQGSALYSHGFLDRLSRVSGCRVLTVEYRLCPEHTAMDATADGVAAYRFLVEEEKVPTANIFFTGESGGGQLLLLVLQALRSASLPQPAGAWVISPVTTCDEDANEEFRSEAFEKETDVLFGTKSFVREFGRLVRGVGTATELPAKDPRGSPLYGAFEGLCPLYFSIAELELFKNEGLQAAERAKQAGVQVCTRIHPLAPHAFPLTDIPEAHEDAALAWAWLKLQAASR